MSQRSLLVPGDRVFFGTVTSRIDSTPGQAHQYPSLISSQIRTALRGRYTEFGEPTFSKVPAATPAALSRAKLSFSKLSNPRIGMGYEFNYSASTLPEDVTEEALFRELTRQIREILLEERIVDVDYINMTGRHHQYTTFVRPERFRDDDEAKVHTTYFARLARYSERRRSNDIAEDESEDQEIEKVAVQARYWSCHRRRDETDAAAASVE